MYLLDLSVTVKTNGRLAYSLRERDNNSVEYRRVAKSLRESRRLSENLRKFQQLFATLRETEVIVVQANVRRALNEQDKNALWSEMFKEKVPEQRPGGKDMVQEHEICIGTYYRWQKRLFEMTQAQ